MDAPLVTRCPSLHAFSPRARFSQQQLGRGRSGPNPAAARSGALQRPRLLWSGSRPVAVASPVILHGA
eukprot:1167238-Heterocapsa_arctica.AAC.1